MPIILCVLKIIDLSYNVPFRKLRAKIPLKFTYLYKCNTCIYWSRVENFDGGEAWFSSKIFNVGYTFNFKKNLKFKKMKNTKKS